jgi:hypothetical protein
MKRIIVAALALMPLSGTAAIAEYAGPGQTCNSQSTEDDAKNAIANSPGGKMTGAEIIEFEDVVDATGTATSTVILSCKATVGLNNGVYTTI